MRQEHFDLGRAHIARVALGMEQDKPSHPIDAGVLGADAVIQSPDAAHASSRSFGLGTPTEV